jgi:hypothetical protein
MAADSISNCANAVFLSPHDADDEPARVRVHRGEFRVATPSASDIRDAFRWATWLIADTWAPLALNVPAALAPLLRFVVVRVREGKPEASIFATVEGFSTQRLVWPRS